MDPGGLPGSSDIFFFCSLVAVPGPRLDLKLKQVNKVVRNTTSILVSKNDSSRLIIPVMFDMQQQYLKLKSIICTPGRD